MDVREIERKIGRMEEQGRHHEAVEWLYEQWTADRNNPALCEMRIAECVQLLAYPENMSGRFPMSALRLTSMTGGRGGGIWIPSVSG